MFLQSKIHFNLLQCEYYRTPKGSYEWYFPSLSSFVNIRLKNAKKSDSLFCGCYEIKHPFANWHSLDILKACLDHNPGFRNGKASGTNISNKVRATQVHWPNLKLSGLLFMRFLSELMNQRLRFEMNPEALKP